MVILYTQSSNGKCYMEKWSSVMSLYWQSLGQPHCERAVPGLDREKGDKLSKWWFLPHSQCNCITAFVSWWSNSWWCRWSKLYHLLGYYLCLYTCWIKLEVLKQSKIILKSLTSFCWLPYWSCFIRSLRNVRLNKIIEKTYQDGTGVGLFVGHTW